LATAGTLAALVVLVLAPASGAAAPGHRLGGKPRIPAGAHALGALSQSTVIQATVALEPRDPAALSNYAQAVSTPGSGAYHQYLTVSQFRQRFAPTAAQLAAVRASLRSHGLRPSAVSASGLLLTVSSPAATIGSAFSTSFERYRLASGQTGFANTDAPSVDPAVAGLVQGVVGLDTLATPQPVSLHRRAARRSAVAGAQSASHANVAGQAAPCTAASGQSAGGGYTADQIASAYRFPSLYSQGDLGSGVTVALYELEPYRASDIASYQSCYGTSASVSNVSVDGGAGRGAGSGEAALDIEDVIGLVPQATVNVYEGPNRGTGAFDTYSRIISDDSAQVISTSWGLCEASAGATLATAENTLFQEAAVQGQSIFAASGDSGSADCLNSTTAAVDDPASQPFVTGVGGTSLPASSPGATETVWNDQSGAGGGGVSTLWPAQSYQSGFALPQSSTACNGSSDCREVPDVSADADPDTGYVIFWGGSWGVIGGTSAAAPTWAALAALADASPTCNQPGQTRTPVGFVNPLLYRAAQHGYSGAFDDVLTGSNAFDSVAGWSAGAGYDMASGLGTPNGSSLPPSLCGDLVSVTTPLVQDSSTGTAQSLQLSATSSAATAITYAASGLPTGIAVDPTSGEISGTPTTAGTYSVTVSATDSSGSVGNATFPWTVAEPGSSNQSTANSQSTTTTTTSQTPTSAQTTSTQSTPLPIPPPTTTPRPSPLPAKPIVTLSRPGSQTGQVGAPEQLRISGRDSLGLALSFSASGLPAGLSINHGTGIVSGKPIRSGSRSVTVRASDKDGGTAAVRFAWTIAGRPRVVAKSLRLLPGGQARLSLSLIAGAHAPAIQRILVASSGNSIRFRGGRPATVSLRAGSGRLLRSRSRIARGALTVQVGRPDARNTTLRLSVANLAVARRLSTRLARGRSRTTTLTITVIDARGVTTKLQLTLHA
jgi:subtilase family serine protease